MKIVLVTGANRGMGWQTGCELSAGGCRVYFGTRGPGVSGEPVKNATGKASWLTIDVSDSESILKASQWLAQRETALDVLINNSGIYPDQKHSITSISRDQLVATFQTNTFGPIEVTQAVLGLLKKSKAARIINVSSGYGRIDGLSADVPSYCLSKLALNGVTLMLAEKLKAHRIAVNSVDPGWVRTDMGGSNATRSVAEGAAGIVWLASQAPHELTGRFFRDGRELGW